MKTCHLVLPFSGSKFSKIGDCGGNNSFDRKDYCRYWAPDKVTSGMTQICKSDFLQSNSDPKPCHPTFVGCRESLHVKIGSSVILEVIDFK
jgi:hypothetical protein